jgi:glycerol-3-phosphate dehydrogenase
MLRSAAIPLAAVLGAGAGTRFLLQSAGPGGAADASEGHDAQGLLACGPIPSREQQLARLRAGTKEHPFDVLIIGGGATGTGCALDAATR